MWLKRGVARHEDRKLGGSFSGLAAVGDQVNDMFAIILSDFLRRSRQDHYLAAELDGKVY